jgi:hypothetical protein
MPGETEAIIRMPSENGSHDHANDDAAIEKRARRYARRLLWLVLPLPFALVAAAFADPLGIVELTLLYSIPAVTACALYLCICLFRSAGTEVPIGPAMVGVGLVVGGAGLDLVATFASDPALEYEGNLVARALLDSGHPLAFVYVYVLVGQVLLVALLCIFWATFLRHYGVVLRTAYRSQPRSRWEFLKAVLGGSRLSWRQFLVAYKPSELPSAYHVAWFICFYYPALMLARWYAGLEWFGVVPWVPFWVFGAVAALLPPVGLCGWILRCYDKDRVVEPC